MRSFSCPGYARSLLFSPAPFRIAHVLSFFLSLHRFFSVSLPRSLVPSFPRSLCLSLDLFLSSYLPFFLSSSLLRFVSSTLPPALTISLTPAARPRCSLKLVPRIRARVGHRLCIWRDICSSFTCMPWLMDMCSITHCRACHDSWTCVLWLNDICAVTQVPCGTAIGDEFDLEIPSPATVQGHAHPPNPPPFPQEEPPLCVGVFVP